ncbi:MAG: PEP-CTERM sorting domain-containing protein [Bryobacteraceae bacterium]|nr:PEP-CTERM sorting domain-containing protein [Bryobacteraceae bacterium]
MNKTAAALSLVFLAAALPGQAGTIIVNHDEWTTSNTGFSQAGATSTGNFVRNVANLLTGGSGDILIYSSNFSLNESQFLNTLTGAGYTVRRQDVNPIGLFSLPNLIGFEAIFLAGVPVPADLSVLQAYVNQGGGVYLAGGTAAIPGGSSGEAAAWDAFLNAFGLDFAATYNGITGNVAPTTAHPLFNGVTTLYYNSGNSVSVSGSGAAVVATGAQGLGLIGVFDDTVGVPEPGTASLLLVGALGFLALRRRSS